MSKNERFAIFGGHSLMSESRVELCGKDVVVYDNGVPEDERMPVVTDVMGLELVVQGRHEPAMVRLRMRDGTQKLLAVAYLSIACQTPKER